MHAPEQCVRVRLATVVSASIALALAVVGCSAPAAPPPTSPSPPSTPTGTTQALPSTLVIEAPSATVTGPEADGYLYYRVKFLLRETTGHGPAVVQSVWPESPDGTDEGYSYGPHCFQRTLVVPAGGTLDVFNTEAGLKSLGCQPMTWGKSPATRLDLIVTFKDDNGGNGLAMASIDLTR